MLQKLVRNCDVCGRLHIWRERKRGFLKTLPIPERFHQELSLDFMTDLPAEKDKPRYLMVRIDQLSKEVILEPMSSMNAEFCTKRFLQCFYRFYGIPKAITSDRDINWVGDFWTRLCEQTGTEQRLSTAFNTQADSATERINQEIQN